MMSYDEQRFEKSLRWFEACKALDGVHVPAILVQLEESGELGKELAEVCWSVIADAIAMKTKRPETPPDTSRDRLLRLCEVMSDGGV